MKDNMGKRIKVGDEKATEIFDKIYQGEIMMDKLKSAMKEGRKNIKKLRVKLKELTDKGFCPKQEFRKKEKEVYSFWEENKNEYT